MSKEFEPVPRAGAFRHRLFEIIFHTEDRVARTFDVVLMVAILASVGVVMLDSVDSIRAEHAASFFVVEWFFTILFTIEYVVRLLIVRRPLRYAFSFFGVVDLLSILPTYISLLFPGAQVLLSVRILRTIRVFRVLKLGNYLSEAEQLSTALASSRRKILVFIFVVLTLVTVMGSAMYLVEGGENGFDSIPRSVYWAVVTVTTVGYGDISPATPAGQALALVLMIMGYGIIAVPTGIVTVELNRERLAADAARRNSCPTCGLTRHDPDAVFCKRCGESLLPGTPPVSPLDVQTPRAQEP
jgi:voltage-gated potassium channel